MKNETNSDTSFTLDSLIEKLLQLPQSATVRFGKAFIDEEAFYLCTTKIRKYFSQLLGSEGLRLLDEIETLAQNSKAHIFGKVSH